MEEYWAMKRGDGGVNSGLEVGCFGKRLRRYFMKAFEPNLEIPENLGIWRDVPNLEMLSLVMPVLLKENEKVINIWG